MTTPPVNRPIAIVTLKPANVSAPTAAGAPLIVNQHEGKPVVCRALTKGGRERYDTEQNLYRLECRPPQLTARRAIQRKHLRFVNRFRAGARMQAGIRNIAGGS